MPPERRDRQQRHARYELRLVLRIGQREVEIRFRRHVEERDRDGSQRLFDIAIEARRSADIMLLPGVRLQDVVVRISTEAVAEAGL